MTNPKTVVVTGATDGIGLVTAKKLVSLGHRVLVHGRSPAKVETTINTLRTEVAGAKVEGLLCDLSDKSAVESLAESITQRHDHLDALINNAGVFVAANPTTLSGLDLRFVVNAIAPYMLTKLLLPILNAQSRVISLSSAAQASVDMQALAGERKLSDGEAYAQSKLAITMWSRHFATSLGDDSPVFISVNPGSFLGSKMVKEAYGRVGRNIEIGADVLTYAVIDDEFAGANGQYFDNDSGQFASPHPDATNSLHCQALADEIELIIQGVW